MSSSPRSLNAGCFLPVFKKLKAAFTKTQANFWQKTQRYGGNFGYQEKNSKIFDRYIQNILEFSKYWSNFCGIFPKNNDYFFLNYEILKNSRDFPKNSRIWKKTQSFWGNVPHVASQKLGQKRPWICTSGIYVQRRCQI